MLELKCLVLGIFQLILRISPKFTPNIINKSLRILKYFLEKSFKVRLYNKNDALIMLFMISLSKTKGAIEK